MQDTIREVRKQQCRPSASCLTNGTMCAPSAAEAGKAVKMEKPSRGSSLPPNSSLVILDVGLRSQSSCGSIACGPTSSTDKLKQLMTKKRREPSRPGLVALNL